MEDLIEKIQAASCPNNIELEVFAKILDMMKEKGVSFLGVRGVNLQTGTEVVIPSQTFGRLILIGALKHDDFIKMMSTNPSDVDKMDMSIKFVSKDKKFGSTDS